MCKRMGKKSMPDIYSYAGMATLVKPTEVTFPCDCNFPDHFSASVNTCPWVVISNDFTFYSAAMLN